jgi:hypothetical protein
MGQTTRHTHPYPTGERQARAGTTTDELQGTDILWLHLLSGFVVHNGNLVPSKHRPHGCGWLVLD